MTLEDLPFRGDQPSAHRMVRCRFASSRFASRRFASRRFAMS